MKKLCVFDLDGTLVNSIEDIANAWNRSFTAMGKPTLPISTYYEIIGGGMVNLGRRALGDCPEEELQKAVALYKKDYLEHCCVATRPYPGIATLLENLSKAGMKLAVLSNKPQVQTEQVANTLLDSSLFLAIWGHRDEFPPKPAPDSLIALAKEIGVSLDEIWFIGDSHYDLELGNNANVDTVAVTWGFDGEEKLIRDGAKHLAHTAGELESILLSSSPR